MDTATAINSTIYAGETDCHHKVCHQFAAYDPSKTFSYAKKAANGQWACKDLSCHEPAVTMINSVPRCTYHAIESEALFPNSHMLKAQGGIYCQGAGRQYGEPAELKAVRKDHVGCGPCNNSYIKELWPHDSDDWGRLP